MTADAPQAEAPPPQQEAASAAAGEPPQSPASSAADSEASQLPELPLFGCKEAYVYRVPPATTAGHRAELWDVNRWLATVSLKVMQADDDAYIRMTDEKTGELFAECPVPTDKPLVTAVEPVVDSSRYFVLRIVDRASQRHAFIGIGFRERNEASDFNAALHEFLQYIKRKRTAEAMRHAYEERERQQSTDGAEAGECPAAAAVLPAADLSIKDGETLTLKIAAPKRGAGGFVSSGKKGLMARGFSLIIDGSGGSVAALSPPPASGSGGGAGIGRPSLDMCVSPSQEGGGGSPMYGYSSGSESGGGGPASIGMAHPRLSGAGTGEGEQLQQRLRGLRLQQQGSADNPPSSSASAASGSPAAVLSGAATEEDDFGDFEAA